MKPDILFITWNCGDCCRVKIGFSGFEKWAFSDDVGKHGQNFVVIQTYSDFDARFALNEFGGLNDKEYAPALLTYDGKKILDIEEIISYLNENFEKD